ncbi:acetyl-CoA carboxylase biotin carboxyl carrier protein [Nonomuraea sp. NPDC059007]|uniref:acetyl-CoA carboxylase biotin carboxyl carrier protein n=1 Tax=Nonomuraea sp. NPDC059007 TaxID=3346692 RepID=UPI00367CC347
MSAADPMERALIAELCHHAAELIAVGGGMRRVRLRSGDTVVELERPEAAGAPAPAPAPAPGAPDEVHPAPGGPGVHHVCAPMVGTFYLAPEPGVAPFAGIGDMVEKGQQIGILEAMKLMNPIEADTSGRLVDILVPDGTPVEYGQKLFAVAPLATP